MRKADCFFEKVSHFGVGIALLFIAMGLSVMGGTVLTLLGFLLAGPAFFLAAYYFASAESPECAIM